MMRADERSLRALLRGDATQVDIPSEMWQNIHGRLAEERAREARRRRWLGAALGRMRMVVAVASAVGIFTLALSPALMQQQRLIAVSQPGLHDDGSDLAELRSMHNVKTVVRRTSAPREELVALNSLTLIKHEREVSQVEPPSYGPQRPY